jgi:hypothetical protein
VTVVTDGDHLISIFGNLCNIFPRLKVVHFLVGIYVGRSRRMGIVSKVKVFGEHCEKMRWKKGTNLNGDPTSKTHMHQ